MPKDDHGLNAVKSAFTSGDLAYGFQLLRQMVLPQDEFVIQSRAARLLAGVDVGALQLQPLRVALIAGTTMDHFAGVLRYWLATVGFAAEIYIAPFDMTVQAVLDPSSPLYAFKPDIVWLFSTYRDVRLTIPAGAEESVVTESVASAVDQAASLWHTLLGRHPCVVLQNNADVPAFDAFGNLSGAMPWGNRTVLRRYNIELARNAPPGVVLVDFDHLAALYGKARWIDARYWFHSKHAFSLDATGLVAAHGARVIAAARGLSKKCLVLDLDNTLWGGVIGDDGLDGIRLGNKADGEAFVAFQAYLKLLKEHGVILAVCSKNEMENAKEPFERHPDMQLRLGDITVFRANWNNKADNIREIATTLNIGIDSLVFVDDNPAERALVRQFLPQVAVPELPEDPAGYIAAIASAGFFEASSFSSEDLKRARYYKENAQRTELQNSFKDVESYLASLDMVAETGPLDAFYLPRMAQLINKSNQFHLTGSRTSEADLAAMAARADTEVRYFKLRDRFGDNGLISVIVLHLEGEALRIATWVMSCRVLARSMEEFIANEIVDIARVRGAARVVGNYVPTAKNKLVANLYARLGFLMTDDRAGTTEWVWTTDGALAPWATSIRRSQPDILESEHSDKRTTHA